jgi:small subunit ribosomal protein S9
MADQDTPQEEPREDEAAAGATPEPAAEETAPAPSAEEAPQVEAAAAPDDEDAEDEAPREKPAIPGMDLEVDIVLDDERERDPYAEHGDEEDDDAEDDEVVDDQPIAEVAIDLRADARYRATGKRKSAVARVILKPGTGVYMINGRSLDVYFPRPTLQRNIRQPLEAVGFEERMDVIARMHGGGVAAQAGALRHGISRALLEADPNLRGELKKRGFLTRDPRVKERKKAGLKKARKRPQFSKR